MTEQFNFLQSNQFTIADRSPQERLACLVAVFHAQFQQLPYQTCLVGGAEEPLYRPASEEALARGESHAIVFTRDYFSSALHEIAHWCIAGSERRRLLDYGYWYCPDGRSEQKQQEFERVEVKPQAIERIFSHAVGLHFRISADNLDMGLGASDVFIQAVHEQTLRYCCEGLPDRARDFSLALSTAFNTENPFSPSQYSLEALK